MFRSYFMKMQKEEGKKKHFNKISKLKKGTSLQKLITTQTH